MFTWAASQRKVTCGAGGAPAIPQYAPLSTERKGNVQKYTEKIRHLGQNQIIWTPKTEMGWGREITPHTWHYLRNWQKLTSPLKANGDIHLPRQLVFPFWKNCLKSTDSFSITLENNKCKPGVPQVKATGFRAFLPWAWNYDQLPLASRGSMAGRRQQPAAAPSLLCSSASHSSRQPWRHLPDGLHHLHH